jgi:hypothetical protein
MTTETQQALALVFRRFRDPPVPEDDLVKTMSLTLNWTKPSQAANLLDRGRNAGLVEVHDDGLAPAFDAGEVDVPFGFEPDDELFEPVPTPDDEPTPADEAAGEPAEADDGPADDGGPVLEELVDRIAEARGTERRKAVAAVNAKQEGLGGLVTLPVAGILVARQAGLDVRGDARTALAELRRDASA